MSSNARPVRFAYTIMVMFMVVSATVLAVASASGGDRHASATIERSDHERTAFYTER